MRYKDLSWKLTLLTSVCFPLSFIIFMKLAKIVRFSKEILKLWWLFRNIFFGWGSLFEFNYEHSLWHSIFDLCSVFIEDISDKLFIDFRCTFVARFFHVIFFCFCFGFSNTWENILIFMMSNSRSLLLKFN